MIVKIKNLRCKAYLGLFAWEKKTKRNIILNLAYSLSQSQVSINSTLDYDQLCQKIVNFLYSNSFELVENLTYSLADLLSQEKNIAWIEVECIKTGALASADEVSVSCKKYSK